MFESSRLNNRNCCRSSQSCYCCSSNSSSSIVVVVVVDGGGAVVGGGSKKYLNILFVVVPTCYRQIYAENNTNIFEAELIDFFLSLCFFVDIFL